MRHLSAAVVSDHCLIVSAEAMGNQAPICLGGVTYQLSISTAIGGLRGEWRCGACGNVGTGETRHSLESAMAAVYAAAGAHQVGRHGPPTDSNPGDGRGATGKAVP